jgi:hypothetical protein
MAAIAAMLDERRRWSSKGTFLQLPPMSHQKIRPVLDVPHLLANARISVLSGNEMHLTFVTLKDRSNQKPGYHVMYPY